MLLFQIPVVLYLSLYFLPTSSHGIAVESIVCRHTSICILILALFAKDLRLEGALLLLLKLPDLLKLGLVLEALLAIFVESVEEIGSFNSSSAITTLQLLLLIWRLVQ